MKYAIATNGLSKNYRRLQALVDLTLEVPAGSIYGFLGPNGSGKTTTMRILTGLSRPSHGTAEVMGVPVTSAGRHRRYLGFLAQEPKFYRWMTGRQVLRYVGRFFGAADEKHIDELLSRTGLGDAADRKTKTYSGGMRQRLGIAQALVGRPKLLMLDEPVSSLDPVGRAEVLALMRELKGDTTIFFSTHILDDVQRCSDYVAILDKGRLVTAAKTSDLLASFTKGQLHVVIAGEANDELALKAIPGVVNVNFRGRDGDKWTYDLAAADGRAREVQHHLTRFASENGLALLGCDEMKLNLESVFLKLVGEGEG